jgi:hypothetical protein
VTDTPDTTGPAFAEPETHEPQSAVRWILIAVLVVALVLLVSWARRNPPFDDRVPDPPEALATMILGHDDRGGV